MMNAFYPYFEYVLASELAVGGYGTDEENKSKFLEVFDLNNYPVIFNTSESLETKLKALVDLQRKNWMYNRRSMTQNKDKQSGSLLKMSNYKPLMENTRRVFENQNISLNSYNNDFKTLIESAQNSTLNEQFNKLVLARQTTKDFFRWDVNTDALIIDSMDDILKFDKYEKKLSDNDNIEDNKKDNSENEDHKEKDNSDNTKESGNDEFWKYENVVIESKHKYLNNCRDTKKYTKPNAQCISLYFSQIDTEKNVDYVYVLDSNRKVVDKFTGNMKNFWVNVDGDTAYIYLVSNNSNSGYGYKMEKAAYHNSSNNNNNSNNDNSNSNSNCNTGHKEKDNLDTTKKSGNDEFWQMEDVIIESEHNYSNNCYDIKKYTKPNAQYIGLYFSQIDTEKNVDYVYVLDSNKKVVEKFTGNIKDLRVNVNGDTAYIYLVSNNSNSSYGYKMEKAAYHKN